MSQPAKQTVDGKRLCGYCRQMKPLSEFSPHSCTRDGLRHECKSCHVEQSHWSGLKRRYGITKAQYEQMLAEQNGVCACCRLPEDYKNRTRLSVDHCHETGIIRGLLCHRCNVVVGLVRNSAETCATIQAYLLKGSKSTRRT